MKVLHLPDNVGGQAWGLAQGERRIGIDSKVLYISQNYLNYPYDICLNTSRRNPLSIFKLLKTFLEVYKSYDVFHFNFGSSLIDFSIFGFPLLELPFYKGKKIITFQGCDARQKYETMKRTQIAPCHRKDCYGGMCNSGRLDKIRRKRIKRAEEYANHIFAINPDLMYFLPQNKSTFFPYVAARWYDITPQKYKIDDKIIIIHSPTERVCKGSDYIINAVENLKKRYKNVEFILIEKIPNNQALEIYSKAHLLIDQVLVGWYGKVSVEVMRMGKPVAVYIREEDLKFIPKAMADELKETIININPYNIEEKLAYYIENPGELYRKSEASLDYVHRWHDPVYAASIAKQFYES
jgi:glycosyltransferase involved in cell wall biosynthesis